VYSIVINNPNIDCLITGHPLKECLITEHKLTELVVTENPHMNCLAAGNSLEEHLVTEHQLILQSIDLESGSFPEHQCLKGLFTDYKLTAREVFNYTA
jgi:transketolase C-terminal domain/subunit